jgi:hypothetical protein
MPVSVDFVLTKIRNRIAGDLYEDAFGRDGQCHNQIKKKGKFLILRITLINFQKNQTYNLKIKNAFPFPFNF